MRRLAHGEELADLVEGNVEPFRELRDVVRQQGGVRRVRQGDARVEGAEGLAGQGRQRACDLRGEHHRRQSRHHLLRLAEHRSHAVRQGGGIPQALGSELLRQGGGQGARHVERHGLADALPCRNRVLDPRDLAPHVAGDRAGRKIGDRIEPQVRDRHRLTRGLGLRGRGRGVAARVRRLLRAVLHHAPIDGASRRVHDELELAHRRAHTRGIGKLRGKIRGIETLSLQGACGLSCRLLAQDRAQEVLKRGAGVKLVHEHRLAAPCSRGLTILCKNAES